MKILLMALSVLTIVGCTNDQVNKEDVKDGNTYETTSSITTEATSGEQELDMINGTGSASNVDI